METGFLHRRDPKFTLNSGVEGIGSMTGSQFVQQLEPEEIIPFQKFENISSKIAGTLPSSRKRPKRCMYFGKPFLDYLMIKPQRRCRRTFGDTLSSFFPFFFPR